MKSKTNNFQPKYRGLVVFDLDGVLADFEGAFCEAFGYERREEYHLRKRYPNLADTVSEWVNEPENYRDLTPIFGGVLWMNQIIKSGYYVAIVTARHLGLPEMTYAWMDKYNIRPHEWQCSKNKSETIMEIAERTGLEPALFVDDSVENLQEVKSMVGCECVAWSQPWNIGWYPCVWYDEKSMSVKIEVRKVKV